MRYGGRSTSLLVVILTKNEELNLPHALASLEPLGAEVFVVDSGSADQTVAIAIAAGCHVASRPWTNYADQFQWALENAPRECRWTMRLDADERLTPELADELVRVLEGDDSPCHGFQVKRRVYFDGQWIRHGGYYPTWLLRVWRTGSGRIESKWMDEHIVIENGTVERLGGDIIDENHKGLAFWIDKHNQYSDREVRDLLSEKVRPSPDALEGQAKRRRWLKDNLYRHAPLYFRAFAYWALRYFLLLGFLDGRRGMVFHFLQGFWYRFIVDAKLQEAREAQQSTKELT